MTITFATLAAVIAAHRAYKAFKANKEAKARAAAFDWKTARYDYNRGTAVKTGARY